MTTTTLMITEYDPIEAAMSELRSRYAGVIFPVATKEGMADAKDVKKRLTKLRTGLEAIRKEIKEPALRRTQAIDVEAKGIEKAIREIEGPIADQIEQEEARVEAIKAAAAAVEAARIAEIQGKIAGIRNLPLALAGESSEVIASEIAALGTFQPSPDVFGELIEDCAVALNDALLALTDLYTRVLAQEEAAKLAQAAAEAAQEARRVADEALAAERKAIQEEREAMARERAEMAAARAALADERAKAELAERDRIAEPLTHPNGAPVYSTTTFKDNGKPIMLDENGKRSIFCDIDDGEPEFTLHDKTDTNTAPAPATIAPAAINSVATSDWNIRRVALATADQFDALAGKVAACGVTDFAQALLDAAANIRHGSFDSVFAGADSATLVSFDNALLDATVNCIDALGEIPGQAIAA